MINIRFLGTGGLGGARGRKRLSKDYRRFPTLLVNERFMIDPSEDIFEFEESFMLDGLTKDARDIFITSSALDHLSVSAVERLASKGRLRVFGSEVVCREISQLSGVEAVELKPFGLIRLGELSVLPLPAIFKTEMRGEVALNFLFECEGKTFFYGLDGAWIHPDALPFLKETAPDVFILDCAGGLLPYSSECVIHNNLDMVRAVIEILKSAGAVKDGARFILSHLPADKRAATHDELTEAARELGVRMAYDGYFLGI